MSKFVTVAARINIALLILAFQSSALTFFAEPLAQAPFWRPVYYSIWGATIIVSGASILWGPSIVRSVALIANVAGLCAIISLAHPIDHMTKSFLVGLGLLVCVFILASRAGARWALLCSASVTAFSAALCLIDIALPELFGNDTGRASGFVGNANDAAMQLLLGILIAAPVVPQRFRTGFIAFVGAAIIATLSRSTILVAAAVVFLGAVRRPEMRMAVKRLMDSREVRTGLAALAIWILGAALWNPVFGIGTNSIVDRLGQLPLAVTSFARSVEPLWREAIDPASRDQAMALTEQIESIERTDSSAARALYLRRAISAYLSGPSGGIGLERAYSMSPHNSYILFGVAFSTLGFAIPLLICLLSAAYSPSDFTKPLTVFGLLLFSHDILFFPATTVLISLGMVAIRDAGPSRVPRL